MENRLSSLSSLDEVNAEEKIRELCKFSGSYEDLEIVSFCDVAAKIFVAVFQKIYPDEVSQTVHAKCEDPLLATMMMDEGLEEKIECIIILLRRILRRMYGSSSMYTCNMPRPSTAERTLSRPVSATANKKDKKKKKVKVPSSTDIFRRSFRRKWS